MVDNPLRLECSHMMGGGIDKYRVGWPARYDIAAS
jgi:hypothetical protein